MKKIYRITLWHCPADKSYRQFYAYATTEPTYDELCVKFKDVLDNRPWDWPYEWIVSEIVPEFTIN